MHWEDVVRYLNIALASIGLLLLGRKAALYWHDYQQRTRDFWWVLVCWCLVILLGTAEILLEWDTQFRVLFTLGALILTIKVVLNPNETRRPTFTKEF